MGARTAAARACTVTPSAPDPRVRTGDSVSCVTRDPFNANRFLLKRMTAHAPQSGWLVQDLGEMEGSDHWGNHYSRLSQDGGQTWSSPRPLARAFQNERGKWVRMGESTFLETADGLARIYNLQEYPASGFHSDIWWHTRLMLQEWDPAIGDFAEPRPLDWNVSVGKKEDFWTYGRNALVVSFSRPMVTRSGRIILPVQWIPEEAGYKHPILRWRAGCLLGQRAAGGLHWRVGGFIDLSPRQSTRGVFEPAIAQTHDGRLLMVARASNTSAPHLPSCKWLAQSWDEGETWTNPEPLTWSGGLPAPSPSSGSALIRSSSGNLYWLGNIAPEGASANRPRHPLLLIRMREDETPSLDPDAVIVIDCRQPQEPESLQLSNFKIHQDRKTGEFVMAYARLESREAGALGADSVERRILAP